MVDHAGGDDDLRLFGRHDLRHLQQEAFLDAAGGDAAKALADAGAAARITTRQLLSHASGMEGDFFPPDDAWGASAESYVRKMSLLPQLHDVGAYMCYCNSGFVLAGRVIEVLAGRPWSQLVMERICTPLLAPRAPKGETPWALSPAKSTRPWRKRSIRRQAKV